MEQWDQDFIDAEVDGYFEFGADGCGSFQFGYVRGHADYRLSTCDGKPALEFSWDGCDEMDPAQGRGWANVEDDQMSGMLFFHQGDELMFKATKGSSSNPSRPKKPRRADRRFQ